MSSAQCLLQVNFPYNGPYGDDMVDTMWEMAHAISRQPGLVWKIWMENQDTGQAGGVYLFETQAQAEAYLALHRKRLEAAAIRGIEAKVLLVNLPLSLLNRAPVR
ncbi:TPA: monooxygenase [Stenotrophomonas maltophilia]|nr:monooxygenase [Stenotrophomonas maltophilia]